MSDSFIKKVVNHKFITFYFGLTSKEKLMLLGIVAIIGAIFYSIGISVGMKKAVNIFLNEHPQIKTLILQGLA